MMHHRFSGVQSKVTVLLRFRFPNDDLPTYYILFYWYASGIDPDAEMNSSNPMWLYELSKRFIFSLFFGLFILFNEWLCHASSSIHSKVLQIGFIVLTMLEQKIYTFRIIFGCGNSWLTKAIFLLMSPFIAALWRTLTLMSQRPHDSSGEYSKMSHLSLQYSSSGLSSWKLEPQGTEIKWGTDHNFDQLEISFMNSPMQGT